MSSSFLRSKSLTALVVSVASSGLGVLLLHLPLWDGPMIGDDYLSVKASLTTPGSGGFWSDIWLTGGGKWRPVTTVILYWFQRHFEYSYFPYQMLNLSLLIICAALVGVISFMLCKSVFVATLTSFAISVSQLTWYAQISVFGLMELLAIIFLLLAGTCAVLAIHLPSESSRISATLQLVAFLSLFLCTLTHERYLLTTLCFWILFLANSSQNSHIRRRSWIFLLIPMTHIIIKGLVLKLDPLQGGGESRLRSVYGTWLIEHLRDSFIGILGYFSGSGKYYSQWPLGRMASQTDLQILGPLIICVPFLLLLIVLRSVQPDRTKLPIVKLLDLKTLFIFSLLASTLLPAATVIQRIESRWLLAPQIFLVLFCIAIVTKNFESGLIRLATLCVLPFCLIVVAIHYSGKSDAYTIIRDQPSLIISQLETIAPPETPWVLSLTQDDSTMPTNWQFGYLQAFEQMSNPPYLIAETCPKEKKSTPCVMVELHGANSPLIKIRSANEFLFSS